MSISSGSMNDLARQLADARTRHTALSGLPEDLSPPDAEAAYAAQQEILSLCDARLGGWKVGAKSADGPIQGAPLPANGVRRSPASFRRDEFGRLGLELEIAFYFNRSFAPREQPYSAEEVWVGVRSMAATIEIVASRFADWPRVDKLAQLADLQNHGALIVGEAVAYQEDYPFERPTMSFTYGGEDIIRGVPANPAGDPRRLLPWLVNHCTKRGLTVSPAMIVTGGSYTGMHFPVGPGEAVGRIAGLPEVRLAIV
jgi:2-keto-4-pentenoate hydratase